MLLRHSERHDGGMYTLPEIPSAHTHLVPTTRDLNLVCLNKIMALWTAIRLSSVEALAGLHTALLVLNREDRSPLGRGQVWGFSGNELAKVRFLRAVDPLSPSLAAALYMAPIWASAYDECAHLLSLIHI